MSWGGSYAIVAYYPLQHLQVNPLLVPESQSIVV